MAKSRNIALNAAGGAQVLIRCTQACVRMEIIEDEASAPQGLIFQDLLDGFAATKQVTPGTEPLIYGQSAPPARTGCGRPLGYGPQSGAGGAVLGTLVWQGTSAGAVATTVRVTEYEA